MSLRPERLPVELVPAHAQVVVALDWPTATREPRLRRYLELEKLEAFGRAVGFRPEDIEQVVILVGEGDSEETYIIRGSHRKGLRGEPTEAYGRYRLTYLDPPAFGACICGPVLGCSDPRRRSGPSSTWSNNPS